MGTINAASQPGQTELVKAILQAKVPLVVAALRLPYDIMAFPEIPVYLCTYSILEPSMTALAKALFGQIKITGKLPVMIPGVNDPQGLGS